uniref:Uncharacterized protein n=1 Tax=Rhizophora mucronata TaxID=61149 RepID=A0A2P2IN26_RHIMU
MLLHLLKHLFSLFHHPKLTKSIDNSSVSNNIRNTTLCNHFIHSFFCLVHPSHLAK